MPNMKARPGFTFFEMIMVLVIFLILVGVSVPFYSYFQTFSATESARQEVLEIIRLTQTQAITGVNNTNHGVYFNNTQWITYQGDNYTNRETNYDQSFDLPNNISFSGLEEINFEINTGLPSSNVSLILINSNINSSEHININSIGLLE